MHVLGTDSTKGLNFYLPSGQQSCLFIHFLGSFTVTKRRINSENVWRGCQSASEKCLPKCVGLHSSFTSCSLTSPQLDKDLDFAKPSCCARALQKETYSALYVIEFITVIYINVDYLTLPCCLARRHLSEPKCWTRAMQRLKNRCISLQQPTLLGSIHTSVHAACRDKYTPALQTRNTEVQWVLAGDVFGSIKGKLLYFPTRVACY